VERQQYYCSLVLSIFCLVATRVPSQARFKAGITRVLVLSGHGGSRLDIGRSLRRSGANRLIVPDSTSTRHSPNGIYHSRTRPVLEEEIQAPQKITGLLGISAIPKFFCVEPESPDLLIGAANAQRPKCSCC